MCGLISFLGDEGVLARRAVERMRHRGLSVNEVMEKAGLWTLGRTRLPIVGTDDGGDFTPPYEHKGWTFLFVGEILNYKEFVPSARCDVEVLARLWVEEGPACLRRFDGFWSVVVVPPDGGCIYAATDFLAKKPLYFRQDRLAFASEIKALGVLGPMTPDPVYFSSVRKWGYHAGERTWAKEVVKVPAGALWRVSWTGAIERDDAFDGVSPSSEVPIAVAVRRAVEARVLSSDVPVAILLSGGLDSSIVFKIAEGLRQDMTIYHAPNDERDYLNLLNPKGKLVEVSWDRYPIEDVLRANEGPVDLGSMLPQYALGQAVEERVALSGDGADELFGGYRRAREYDSQGSDVFEELPFYHCPRLDKLMMAGTVELRSPFMGREVLAAALSVPREWRTEKEALKDAFEGVVPDEILRRPKAPLKSPEVLSSGIGWSRALCDRFEKMIEEGNAT
jgi:asparagine synthase (glutamine-hydrolysing)